MELHLLDKRDRSNELERMVGNAKRASDFLKALAHESRLRKVGLSGQVARRTSE